MTKPIQLVPEHAEHDLTLVLKGLLRLAEAGELQGMVFGCALRGEKYYCDAAGRLHRNRMLGLGVARLLSSEIAASVRHQSTDTVLG